METQIGVYFKKISEKLERRANCEGNKRDITYSQGKVLWYLHKHEDENVTMRDIEKFFDCSHATVSGIVSRLVEKGYVAVETDKKDRRAKNVRTTEKENASFRDMQARHRQMEELLLCGFSDEEKKSFVSFLDRVYGNLEETSSEDSSGYRGRKRAGLSCVRRERRKDNL